MTLSAAEMDCQPSIAGITMTSDLAPQWTTPETFSAARAAHQPSQPHPLVLQRWRGRAPRGEADAGAITWVGPWADQSVAFHTAAGPRGHGPQHPISRCAADWSCSPGCHAVRTRLRGSCNLLITAGGSVAEPCSSEDHAGSRAWWHSFRFGRQQWPGQRPAPHAGLAAGRARPAAETPHERRCCPASRTICRHQ